MINSLAAQLDDWGYTRGLTLKFLSELSDSDLDKKLPRKNLNTIRLQMEELAQIQKNYIDSLATKEMDFAAVTISDTSKKGLADTFAKFDKELATALEAFDGTETIGFYGESMNIHHYIAAMAGHENMHIGQIIAFCYATGIEIPAEIVETMALDG